MEDASAAVALVAAIVTVFVTLYGILERGRAYRAQQRQLRDEADRWERSALAALNREEVRVRSEFLMEQYRFRLRSYAPVLRALGVVSYAGEASAHFNASLRQGRDKLREAADILFENLYGEAGLLMTMTTRSHVHNARQECLAFLESDGGQEDVDRLVDAFFYARRLLRADLELIDDRSPENLNNLAQRLKGESRAESDRAAN